MTLASWDSVGEGRRAGELGWKEPPRELEEEVAALRPSSSQGCSEQAEGEKALEGVWED